MSDPVMDRLAALPEAAPDAARAARTRAQCRACLRAHAVRAVASTEPRADGLWRPAITALGVLYMIEALMLALGAYGAG